MTKNMLLSRDEILSASDLTFEVVDVPEWGGAVRVRGLTATERDHFESSLIQGTGKIQKINTQNIRSKLCTLTIVDEEGVRMFNDADIAILGQKSAAALDRVYDVASRLSKLSKDDVDELVGNSESDHSGDS